MGREDNAVSKPTLYDRGYNDCIEHQLRPLQRKYAKLKTELDIINKDLERRNQEVKWGIERNERQSKELEELKSKVKHQYETIVSQERIHRKRKSLIDNQDKEIELQLTEWHNFKVVLDKEMPKEFARTISEIELHIKETKQRIANANNQKGIVGAMRSG